MDWTRSEITNLIHLYRQYESLWNTAHEDYNNYDTKQSAWLDIAEASGKDVDDVKRKVKNLRSAYVAEKKKSGASKDYGVTYKPNLFYYNEFDFLDSVVILRKSTLSPTASQSFLASRNKDNTSSSTQSKISVNKQRKHKIVKVERKSQRDSKFSSAIDAIVASVSQTPQARNASSLAVEYEDDCNNVFNSFGKTTALQLQQLPLDKATEAMSDIFQLVAKKTMDSLNKSKNEKAKRNGVISFENMSP